MPNYYFQFPYENMIFLSHINIIENLWKIFFYNMSWGYVYFVCFILRKV